VYVPSLKKNLISVAVLEDKGYRVIFMDKKALLWSKNQELSSAIVVGVREGGLYKLPGHIQALVHALVRVHLHCGIEGLDIFTSKRSPDFRKW
jgi:hypothetical protein